MGQVEETLTDFDDASEDLPSRRAGDDREVIGIGPYEDAETNAPFRGAGSSLSRRYGAK